MVEICIMPTQGNGNAIYFNVNHIILYYFGVRKNRMRITSGFADRVDYSLDSKIVYIRSLKENYDEYYNL